MCSLLASLDPLGIKGFRACSVGHLEFEDLNNCASPSSSSKGAGDVRVGDAPVSAAAGVC